MERKFGGLLLSAMGVLGLVMAYLNLMQMVTNQSYGNNIYNTGDQGTAGVAAMGYGLIGLILIFLGIKMLRRKTSM